MHPLLRAQAERRLGLFTAADTRRAGYTNPEVRRLLASGRWVRLRRGVYATADDLPRHEERHSRHLVDCLAVLASIAPGRPSATPRRPDCGGCPSFVGSTTPSD